MKTKTSLSPEHSHSLQKKCVDLDVDVDPNPDFSASEYYQYPQQRSPGPRKSNKPSQSALRSPPSRQPGPSRSPPRRPPPSSVRRSYPSRTSSYHYQSREDMNVETTFYDAIVTGGASILSPKIGGNATSVFVPFSTNNSDKNAGQERQAKNFSFSPKKSCELRDAHIHNEDKSPFEELTLSSDDYSPIDVLPDYKTDIWAHFKKILTTNLSFCEFNKKHYSKSKRRRLLCGGKIDDDEEDGDDNGDDDNDQDTNETEDVSSEQPLDIERQGLTFCHDDVNASAAIRDSVESKQVKADDGTNISLGSVSLAIVDESKQSLISHTEDPAFPSSSIYCGWDGKKNHHTPLDNSIVTTPKNQSHILNSKIMDVNHDNNDNEEVRSIQDAHDVLHIICAPRGAEAKAGRHKRHVSEVSGLTELEERRHQTLTFTDTCNFSELDELKGPRRRSGSEVSGLTEADGLYNSFAFNVEQPHETDAEYYQNQVNLSFSSSTSSPTSDVEKLTPPLSSSQKPPLPRMGRPPLIQKRCISDKPRAYASNGSVSSRASGSSYHRRTHSDFVFSVSRLSQICQPATSKVNSLWTPNNQDGITPTSNSSATISKRVPEVHVNRDTSNVSPMDDDYSSIGLRERRLSEESTSHRKLYQNPTSASPYENKERKFFPNNSLDGLNVNLFGLQTSQQNPHTSFHEDNKIKERRDDSSNNINNHNTCVDLNSSPTRRRKRLAQNRSPPKQQSPTKTNDETNYYLPKCSLFLKYLRSKGITGQCIFEGWVAFSLGRFDSEQLKSSKIIRRRDVRYVLIVGLDKPVLYAFLSPDLDDCTEENNDAITIDLSQGIWMEVKFSSKRKGHYLLIKDARYRRTLCSLLPTPLPKTIFVDDICSRLVREPIYTSVQHSLTKPRRKSKKGKPVWGDPEYLLKYASVAQHESATFLLFSVGSVVRKCGTGLEKHTIE